MRKLFIALFALSLLTSCSSDDADAPVEIRVSNDSTFTFDEILVSNKTYGSLAPGEDSQYQDYAVAYRYDYIRLVIAQDTVTYQPIDFVGETPLSGGKYTYSLDVDNLGEENSSVILTFIED